MRRLVVSCACSVVPAALIVVAAGAGAARAEPFNVDLTIDASNMHPKCFEAFNDITRASEKCAGPDCEPLVKIIDAWRAKCLCDKARAAKDDECHDRQTESESLFWIIDAVKAKMSGDVYEKRLMTIRTCVDDYRKFAARFDCKPGECGAAYDDFEKWEKRCVTGVDYIPNDNVLFQVLLVKSELAVRKGTDARQLAYARMNRPPVKDEAYAQKAAAIWGALTNPQERAPLPRVIAGCGSKCYVADVCGDYVRDAAAYLDRLFDCAREQGTVAVFDMEYRDAPVLNVIRHTAAKVLGGSVITVEGEKTIRERVLFDKKAGALREQMEQARRLFSQNKVREAIDGLLQLYREYQVAPLAIRSAVAGDIEKHTAWVRDLYRTSGEQLVAGLAKMHAKPDEWIAHYDKVVQCPLGPLYRGAAKEAEEDDGTVCILQEMWKKAPIPFDEAVLTLDADLARLKGKIEQGEFDKRKKDYQALLNRCAQGTNRLLGVIRRVDACKKSPCSAKTLGTIDDDRQRAQDDLDDTLNKLNALLGEMRGKQIISADKEAEIRRQGKRQGCLQLAQ